ncbi:hypothetical protein GOODEAATRI_010821 [Goodea atripinnis]|uniref:Uncharacterized protein n=1 Tax=Goodea atripinnis TaxID=208336 RepID=A0ABV0N9K5_9TELE
MVHAAYAPLADPAVVRSGRSVGFTAAAHGPALTALRTRTSRSSQMFSSTWRQTSCSNFPSTLRTNELKAAEVQGKAAIIRHPAPI